MTRADVCYSMIVDKNYVFDEDERESTSANSYIYNISSPIVQEAQ